ncbi:MAG: hypothetical protein AAGJ52_07870 [Pseudomonadota bacterium]
MSQDSLTGTTLPLIDLIIVIDNSGSMGNEILNLQNRLYDDLVGPLLDAGVAVQVIMVAKFGDLPSESVCIEEPLSSIPTGGCATPPAMPGNTAIFRQYSVEVGSQNSWCLLQTTFDATLPDEFGLAPTGWQDWLQPDSYRVILMVSDDGVNCSPYNDLNTVAGGATAAAAIDTDLLALSPSDFGSAGKRNYIVHSLVGLEDNMPGTAPWPPTDPVISTICFSAVDPGTGHQSMSTLTGGLRFPLCRTNDYSVFFRMIVESIYPLAALFRDRFEFE